MLFFKYMQKTIKYLDDISHFNDPETYWVFLFHGFGADASDLKDLSHIMTPEKKKINWVFPEGIYSVPIGPMMSGRAWWPLTMSQLPSDWTEYSPDNLEILKTALWKLIESFRIPWAKIILGGFSQGAMLATELYLSAPEKPAGLMSLSGSLIRKSAWSDYCRNRTQSKVFLSHGEQDQVLPSSGTHKLIQLFKFNNIECQVSSFRGGHEIPMTAILKAKDYLAQL